MGIGARHRGDESEGSKVSRALARRFATWPVRAYQLLISPWLGPACRFEPSCSRYAISAIERHGVVRGVGFSARRLARCHPLGGSGYDPVP